jgi:hypothetical protein
MSDTHFTPATVPGKTQKPAKSYPEFPLTVHPKGYWCKKIRGKLYYFGPLADPEGALTKYLAEKDALHAGRKPREATEGYTIKQLCNEFLAAKACHGRFQRIDQPLLGGLQGSVLLCPFLISAKVG